MDSFKSSAEADIKRASLLSIQKFSINDKNKKDLVPPDPYYLTHIIFFFFGLGGMLPMTFFLTAQDYWMYKFRNITLDEVDLKHKTVLQANFVSISSITHSIPAIITTLVASRYGHKINIRKRLIGTLSVVAATFLVFTGFIKINTDPWQLEFFILTLLVSTTITVSVSLFLITNLSLIARFPPIYLKMQMYASSASGLFSATLQILCLYIGGSSTTTALIYFLCGSTVLTISSICAIMTKHVPRFVYYLGDTEADAARPTQTWAQIKQYAKKLWPNIVLMIFGMITGGMGHPNISTLVVSENYDSGNAWNGKFFTPVTTFLLPDIFGLMVRFLARPFVTPKNAPWFVLVDMTRIVALGPLLLFCNARPRHNLPVLFPHDWEYILIINLNITASTFLSMSLFMSMENMVPGNAEQGFLLMSSLGGVVGSIASTLSSVWVNIL